MSRDASPAPRTSSGASAEQILVRRGTRRPPQVRVQSGNTPFFLAVHGLVRLRGGGVLSQVDPGLGVVGDAH